MLQANNPVLFREAEFIEKTVNSLQRCKKELKNTADAWRKNYLSECVKFERDLYFSSLGHFESLAGHTNWRQYV